MSEETTAAGTGEQEAYEPDPRRWRILGVTLVIGFMALLDVTIVNVAVPSMRAGLDTSASTIQWVVSGYSLAFGLVLVTGGRLGDAYGRRRMMLMGLVGFVAASAAVGLAPTAAWVIVAPQIQGAAPGFLTPQNSGLIQQLYAFSWTTSPSGWWPWSSSPGWCRSGRARRPTTPGSTTSGPRCSARRCCACCSRS